MKGIRLTMYFVMSLMAAIAMCFLDLFLGLVTSPIEAWRSAKQIEQEVLEEDSKWKKFYYGNKN
jgi:uncharacterized membrane protein